MAPIISDPCQMPKISDDYSGIVSDGNDLYVFYFDNNLRYQHLAKIGFPNGVNCTVTNLVQIPEKRMWSPPYYSGGTIFYVSRQNTIVRLDLKTLKFTEFSLPNDPLFGFGWTMKVISDIRNSIVYINNVNSVRMSSFWSLTPANNLTLLAKGDFGRVNIAMALNGLFWDMDTNGLIWRSQSDMNAWSVDSLELELSIPFTQRVPFNGGWCLDVPH